MSVIKASLLLLAVCSIPVAAYVLQLEAENGIHTGNIQSRSSASGDATVYLSESGKVTNTFTTSSCSVSVENVAYTNDGGSDTIMVYLDGLLVGSFVSKAGSNYGQNWNVIRNSGSIGASVEVPSGSHELVLVVTQADDYGVELDKSTLDLNCAVPGCINVTSLSGLSSCNSNLAKITHSSVNTGCAEEDNVKIPLYYTGIKNFNITATLPEYYPSTTTLNNREANFTNCVFHSSTIWQIGENDESFLEYSTSCTSNTYQIGQPVSSFCQQINNQGHTQETILFTARGTSSGLVEASIGSVLTITFTQVSGILVIEIRCFGRDETWLSLEKATFTSSSLTNTWMIPDLTWTEKENSNHIELTVVTAESSANAVGKYDFLKLDKRDENGESDPITIFDNGYTIIEAIRIDFWWLHPKAMIIQNLHSNFEWFNISYIRIYRRKPGTDDKFAQLFVLYQDGNSRILSFPPSSVDWIPFGSSVIIGMVNPNSIRPYASIIRVNIDPIALTMEVYYESGGKALLSLQYSSTKTVVKVSDITYNTSNITPFATFRSMWVADGNSDVDHVQTINKSWHIHYGWESIDGLVFEFYRSCVSTHNTLSPNIRIEVDCNSISSTSSGVAPTTLQK